MKIRLPQAGLAAGVLLMAAAYAVGVARTAPARMAMGNRPAHLGVYRDGTFTAWGESYHGRIEASVEIRRGRIASADIATCRMRYPCSLIKALPAQVVARQSAEVDVVSGASQSAEAFSLAVDRALAAAARTGRQP
jgi:uncharacterized protein with FMN-binding domain